MADMQCPVVRASDLLQCFGGASSSASRPVSCGDPKGTEGEVFIGSLGVGKRGDEVLIPSTSDAGPIVSGHGTIVVNNEPLACLDHPVAGRNGTVGSVAAPATDPNVVAGDGTAAPSPILPEGPIGDAIGATLDAIGNVPGPVGNVAEGIDSILDADAAVAAGQTGGLGDVAWKVAENVAGGAAAGAAQPACLSTALAAGIATAPLAATGAGSVVPVAAIAGTWLICTAGAAYVGTKAVSTTKSVLEDWIEKSAKEQAERARSDLARAQGAAAMRGANLGGFFGY